MESHQQPSMESRSGSRNVWVFAEERSGSSWLSRELAVRLGKQYWGVDEFEVNPNWVHQTHEFEFLERIDDFVIRTTRRNKYEHFLSYKFFIERQKQGWKHPHISHPPGVERFQKMLELPPITVSKEDVEQWLAMNRERKRQWANYKYPKQTIYYEDLFEGVSIPELKIDLISFKQGGQLQKLPYNKEEHFTNAEQVREWLSEE